MKETCEPKNNVMGPTANFRSLADVDDLDLDLHVVLTDWLRFLTRLARFALASTRTCRA